MKFKIYVLLPLFLLASQSHVYAQVLDSTWYQSKNTNGWAAASFKNHYEYDQNDRRILEKRFRIDQWFGLFHTSNRAIRYNLAGDIDSVIIFSGGTNFIDEFTSRSFDSLGNIKSEIFYYFDSNWNGIVPATKDSFWLDGLTQKKHSVHCQYNQHHKIWIPIGKDVSSTSQLGAKDSILHYSIDTNLNITFVSATTREFDLRDSLIKSERFWWIKALIGSPSKNMNGNSIVRDRERSIHSFIGMA